MRPMSLVLFLSFALLAFSAGHTLPGLAEWESRDQKVWVREGSSAVLPCHLSLRKMRKSLKQLPDVTSVQWKRHGGSVHQEPHGVLEVEFPGLQKTAQLMKPRVSLQASALRNGNFSLRIDPVWTEDAGLYEARVKYNTEVHICHVELGVITVTLNPPSPVMENELVLMNCNSSHQASLVETCWFHNGHLDSTSRTFCFLSGTVSILRPSMSDAGSWRCQLRYSDNKIISATYNLQILGFDGPTNPVVYAAAGSAAHLPCNLSHLPSSLQINAVTAHWSHLGGGHLQDWGVSQNLSSRSFPLHLPLVGPGDAGHYRCAVSVGHKTISRNVTLAVITVTPSIQGPVSEGSHLLLICSLTHSQGHERFQWKHLGSVPSDSKLAVATPCNLEDHKAQMGPTLEIPKVSQKDIGTWECSVYGPEGQLGAVEYGLQMTGAQVSNPLAVFSGQVTFGLILTLFLLLAACVVALALLKRAKTPAFPALEGMFAVAGPWMSMKENQKEKIQQTEC
ncbi:lymphocyte activation gene 3 protein isoform X1 [Pithys albifrons albifrons]|uniref:lymphocyte activation gene 3 protein isoform X1 n=1 Tax=Pithys albifrons albifrons TaxID=3385563 RepID=UPI003A5CFA88